MKILSAICFVLYLGSLCIAIISPFLGTTVMICSVPVMIITLAYGREIFNFCCRFMDEDDK